MRGVACLAFLGASPLLRGAGVPEWFTVSCAIVFTAALAVDFFAD